MKQAELDKMKGELEKAVSGIRLAHDMSDVGNAIGAVVGKYLRKYPGEGDTFGLLKDDFMAGIEHGISLNEKNPNDI